MPCDRHLFSPLSLLPSCSYYYARKHTGSLVNFKHRSRYLTLLSSSSFLLLPPPPPPPLLLLLLPLLPPFLFRTLEFLPRLFHLSLFLSIKADVESRRFYGVAIFDSLSSFEKDVQDYRSVPLRRRFVRRSW